MYLNIVGGLKVHETAADLAVALAVVSSYTSIPVRSVSHLLRRSVCLLSQAAAPSASTDTPLALSAIELLNALTIQYPLSGGHPSASRTRASSERSASAENSGPCSNSREGYR